MVSLFYEGTGPGQAERISIRGFVFVRGSFTAVPDDIAARLVTRPGFSFDRPKENNEPSDVIEEFQGDIENGDG